MDFCLGTGKGTRKMLVDELREFGLPEGYVNILKKRKIERLNPVQVAAVKKGLVNGKNILVSAPTGSGKTLIAEIALVKTFTIGGIGVYLTPLRALASEKYDEFRKLEEIGLATDITTGDYDKPAEYLGESDVIIATYERFDSLLRTKPSWLNRLKTVVIDELHMVSDPERGPIIEMIIARLLRRNIQLIGLSATIGNPEELATWIRGELVNSDWRPVTLIEGFYEKRRKRIVFPQAKREEDVEPVTGDNIIDLVLHNVERGFQTLVFIHNRKKVEEYAAKLSMHLTVNNGPDIDKVVEKLEEAPTRYERDLLANLMERGVGFHHAGLSSIARRVVEEAFKKRLLKVVFATPTLAAGVNLPARRVLVSVKRYDPTRHIRVNISVAEYKQMAGRAGRPGYDEIGEAIILDATSPSEAMKFINGSVEKVSGKMMSERALRIHTLSLIASRDANSLEELLEVFSDTLSSRDTGNVGFLRSKVSEIIHRLIEMEMIMENGGYLRPTTLGLISSRTYIDPLTVSVYMKLKHEEARDLYLLHTITLTPDYLRSMPYIRDEVLEYFGEDISLLARHGNIPEYDESLELDYDTYLESYVHALILYDWINEKSEDEILEKFGIGPGDLYNMRETAMWISYALSVLERTIGNIAQGNRLKILSERLERGVKEDALELTRLKYIGRVRARILINHGIRSLRDLAKTPPEKLLTLPSFGKRVVEEIYEQLRQMRLL